MSSAFVHLTIVGAGLGALATAYNFCRGFLNYFCPHLVQQKRVSAAPVTPASTKTDDCRAPEITPAADGQPACIASRWPMGGTVLLCARLFLVPLTLAAFAWASLLEPEAFAFLPTALATPPPTLAAALPPFPASHEEAFRYGAARELLRQSDVSAALSLASEVAGRPVTAAQLSAMKAAIDDFTHHRGLVSRAKAILSLANTATIIGTTGLSLTALPLLAVVLHTLKVDRLAVALFHLFVVPAREAGLAVISAFCLSSALRNYTNTDGCRGEVLSLGAIAAFYASSFVLNGSWLQSLRVGQLRELVTPCMIGLGALFSAAPAIGLQSTLLGYATVAQLICALGLFADTRGLVTLLGFRSHDATATTVTVCGLMNAIMLLVRATNTSSRFTRPFGSAVSVLGTAVFYLGQLVYYYNSDQSARTAMLYFGSMGISALFGTFYGFPGMVNVSLVYSALFLHTEYCCRWRRYGTTHDRNMCFFFCASCFWYVASLMLNRHPEYVTSLMSMGLN